MVYNTLNTNLFNLSELTDAQRMLINDRTYLVREQKIMIDTDLAKLYGCELKYLRSMVERNASRFQERHLFQLNDNETFALKARIDSSKTRINPYAFTEEGICMLSTILNTDFAVKHSIYIVRSLANFKRYVLSL